MVSATKSAWEDQRTRSIAGADACPQGPNAATEDNCQSTEDDLRIPLDPPLTEEIQDRHTEILALQIRSGLSYKDAAPRLYMASVEKLKSERKVLHSIREFRQRMDKSITTWLKLTVWSRLVSQYTFWELGKMDQSIINNIISPCTISHSEP